MKNVRSIRGLALTGVAALGLIAMTPAVADSEFDIGNGALTANADLDFEIVIPRFLYLQVGSAGTTVDTVTFDLSGVASIADVDSQIGNGTAVDGDITVGVRLVSNAGDVDLEAVGSGTGLTNGTETIPWSQITGTAATGGATGLDVPVVGAAAVTIPATNGVVNRSDTWSFDYENDLLVSGGTYTGTVTYTATAP
ncbi:hypothetical protein GCM10011521_05590 [Arenimonas soli]|uniref:WxL domain-containing protein n=1 Tax=Arenimonas soli TaxID=2269504 RepID=A0ABQ1HBZ8_9GAMM|nr:hypothetical protein [Arenimonas soli]GGA70338.1 hypothetical protein GCM10011521_05590 [Arenimonas soli]